MLYSVTLSNNCVISAIIIIIIIMSAVNSKKKHCSVRIFRYIASSPFWERERENDSELLLIAPLCPGRVSQQLQLYILKKMRAVKSADYRVDWGRSRWQRQGFSRVMRLPLSEGNSSLHWTKKIKMHQASVMFTKFDWFCSFMKAVYLTTQNIFIHYDLHFLLF